MKFSRSFPKERMCGQVQRYEIKNYFGKSYASTCQHCGITIYRRNKNGNGKHAWLAYSKAAYKADAEFEVLCRGCYDKAVKEYGPVISREEMLKKIDKAIYKWVAKREQGQKQQGEKLEEVEKAEKTDFTNTDTPFGTSESFKPYPIYTRENVNMLLRAYRKVKKTKQQSSQLQNSQQLQQLQKLKLMNSDDFHANEATVRNFLTFITGFTVGAGMTKRPVMLDAAHKYIGRFYDEYGKEHSEEHSEAVNLDLDSISDFFDSMAGLGMIRDSVAKKARNICRAIKNNGE